MKNDRGTLQLRGICVKASLCVTYRVCVVGPWSRGTPPETPTPKRFRWASSIQVLCKKFHHACDLTDAALGVGVYIQSKLDSMADTNRKSGNGKKSASRKSSKGPEDVYEGVSLSIECRVCPPKVQRTRS